MLFIKYSPVATDTVTFMAVLRDGWSCASLMNESLQCLKNIHTIKEGRKFYTYFYSLQSLPE